MIGVLAGTLLSSFAILRVLPRADDDEDRAGPEPALDPERAPDERRQSLLTPR
jgi:hypothetical protein